MSSATKEEKNCMSSVASKKTDANIEKELSRDEFNQESTSLNKENCQQSGYLTKAMSGVSTGVMSVGTAGFNSVKWIAGATYNVTSGVVGTAASAAGSVVGVVIKRSPKEHTD